MFVETPEVKRRSGAALDPIREITLCHPQADGQIVTGDFPTDAFSQKLNKAPRETIKRKVPQIRTQRAQKPSTSSHSINNDPFTDNNRNFCFEKLKHGPTVESRFSSRGGFTRWPWQTALIPTTLVFQGCSELTPSQKSQDEM